MTQPTFADGPPVPLMTEGAIDGATLRQMAADLRAYATILGVREKAGRHAYAAAEELTLEDAIDRLFAGQSRAVQVRYLFDGSEWTDTIMQVPTGFAIVRCRHEI